MDTIQNIWDLYYSNINQFNVFYNNLNLVLGNLQQFLICNVDMIYINVNTDKINHIVPLNLNLNIDCIQQELIIKITHTNKLLENLNNSLSKINIYENNLKEIMGSFDIGIYNQYLDKASYIWATKSMIIDEKCYYI